MSRVSRLFVLAVVFVCISAFGDTTPPPVVEPAAPVVEPNVNMVAGTDPVTGDPYLQRQNEASIAVSSRNPLVMLSLTNDYRAVDIPFDPGTRPDGEDTGDAWIGVFQTRDGGRTWHSTLLEGYPQQTFSSSPLHGFQAAADPVVRAADHGLFFATGIVLNRDSNPLSGVFIARFIHINNSETGDPVTPLGVTMIDRGTSGQFIDKPWLAVDPTPKNVPCTVNGQTFPTSQNVYVAYTVFVGGDNNIRTKLMFARSTDCGNTWSAPTKLSEGFPINQGATIAVAPNGTVYVFWRQFHTTQVGDAIIMAKSTDQGQTFTKGAIVQNITPFEQPTSIAPLAIRTNAYPSAAIDSTGRIYLVWQSRSGPAGYGTTPANDGRIVLSTSNDGGTTWTSPVAIDPNPANGHQFQPTLLATGNKLTVAYYDLRDDSTLGRLLSNGTEVRDPKGDLPGSPQWVFTTYLAEQSGHRRHTLDVRAAQAPAGPSPLFASKRISRYVFGTPHNPAFPPTTAVTQLQVNPPNFPLFRNGTAPFIGDYIDMTGYANGSTVQHVVWTDNRDVRPPINGDWVHYTPVGPGTGRQSTFNPGQIVPDCVVGMAGMRNQNIYTTRLTEGLFAGAATDAKQLNIQRAFPVFVQNTKSQPQSYTMTIQATGGTIASFYQDHVDTTPLVVNVPGRTTATRTIFVSPNAASPHASVNVIISETGVPAPLSTTVVLNPDMSNPDMSNPDMSNNELHNPDMSNPDMSNPDFSNSNFQTPDMSNPDMSNPDMSNLDIQNRDIANPDFSNPDMSNPDFSNPDMSNPDFSNPDMSNATLSDTTWTGTNHGNATSGYNVKLVSNGPPPGIKTQLLITRIYQTPTDFGCKLAQAKQRQVLANIPNPTFTPAGGNLLDPIAKDGEGTYWLAPGETIQVTLRVFDPDKTDNITFDPSTAVTAVTVSQAINIVNGQPSGSRTSAAGLAITRQTVPNGVVNQPYLDRGFEISTPVTLTATGGIPPYTWAAVKGLPAGLTVGNLPNDQTLKIGVISGTPTAPADTLATISVTDSAGHVATKTYAMHIAQPLAITTASANDAVTNDANYSSPFVATGGTPPYSWSVGGPNTTFTITSNGVVHGTFTQAGTANLFVNVSDSATPKQMTSQTYLVHVGNPVAFGSLSMPTVMQGDPVDQQLTSSGGVGAIHWSVASGALPAGVSLSDTGALSGAPTVVGSFPFQLKITDSGQPAQTLTSGNLQIVATAPPAGCGATVSLLTSNWNTDPVVNRLTAATTFSTGGTSYCLDAISNYHWNGGVGATPGQIGLTTNCGTSCTVLGPWQAVGSSGQGGAPNVNWTARPPATTAVVLNGTYNVTDSDPATWSQNAKSGGAGFSAIYVRSYTPQIHTATVHLTYNGLPLSPSVAPQMFVRNLATGADVNASQVVWNGADTVTVSGLTDARYVIEVAIPKDANTPKYLPGGFWMQTPFQIAGADVIVTMPESRLIHLTSPADNTNSLGTDQPCPASLTIPNPTNVTWENVDPAVTNVTYRYKLDLADCNGSRQTMIDSSTSSLSVPIGPLAPTSATQFYQLFLYADSPAEQNVGQIMTVGSDFYGWSLVFRVPPPSTFNVVANLKYNGAPQSLSGANAISVLNTDTNTLVNPSNVVYDGNSTITMTGLAAGKYAIEVASQEGATALYQPGSFLSYTTFDAATASQSGLGIDLQRTIHMTVPIDNKRSYGALQCPPALALANVSTISIDPIDVPATYRYSIWAYPCGPGTGTQVAAGNFDGTVAAFNELPLSKPGEYYALTIDAFSATNTALFVGGIVSAGTNFHRRDLEFVVVPPGLSFNVAPASTTFSVTGNGSVVQINGTVANATSTSQTVFLQCFIDQGSQSVGAGGNADIIVTPNTNQAVDPARNIAESGNAAQAGFQPGPATLRIQLKQGTTVLQTLSFPITLTP